MRFIKKLVELYILDYLKTQVKIEDIIKSHISDFVRQNDKVSEKVKQEIDKYVEDKIDEEHIKLRMDRHMGSIVRSWIEDKKTFKEIEDLKNQTVESNPFLKSLTEQELTEN